MKHLTPYFPQHHQRILHACLRSNLAYVPPLTVKKIWMKQTNQDGIHEKANVIIDPLFSNIFDDVEHEPIFINNGHGAKAYTWTKGKTLFINFRGLHNFNLSDLKAIVDIRHHQYMHFGKIQFGLWRHMMSIITDIKNQIATQKDVIDTLDITGHSLGASMAAITAFELKTNSIFNNLNIQCHVFGGPQMCDKDFSNTFMDIIGKNNCSHTIIKQDPIPFVFTGFQHCIQSIIYINDDQSDTDDKEVNSCLIRSHSSRRYYNIFATMKSL